MGAFWLWNFSELYPRNGFRCISRLPIIQRLSLGNTWLVSTAACRKWTLDFWFSLLRCSFWRSTGLVSHREKGWRNGSFLLLIPRHGFLQKDPPVKAIEHCQQFFLLLLLLPRRLRELHTYVRLCLPAIPSTDCNVEVGMRHSRHVNVRCGMGADEPLLVLLKDSWIASFLFWNIIMG